MKNIESNRIEFKEKLTNELEKEIVAFLNYKEGGFVYIGIDKNSNVVGLKDADDVQLRIKDRLKNNILPSCMGLFDVVKEDSEGKRIIKIVVASGSEKPYYVKKNGMSERGCFIRIGSSSEPMQQRIIEDLFAKRTRNSIGRIISNRQDLTFAQLKIYYEAVDRTLNSNFLQNLELLTKDKELNYVAYLMADNNGNSIKLAKYDGLKRVHLLENNEYGYCSLIKATKQVLDKIELENRTFAKITSKERIETRYWDAVALREAVINALVHNDYTGEVPPKFEIFDDRIEIISTGGLPNGLSKEDFFQGFSIPRNKEIMRIYKDLDLVEQLGSGVPRILESYSKDCFTFHDNFIRMSFPSEKTGGSIGGSMGGSIGGQISGQIGGQIGGQIKLTERQEEIIRLIDTNGYISRKDLSEELKINESAVSKHLESLKDKGALERIGGTRGYWKVNYRID